MVYWVVRIRHHSCCLAHNDSFLVSFSLCVLDRSNPKERISALLACSLFSACFSSCRCQVPGAHLFYIVFDVLNVSGAGASEALQRVNNASQAPAVINGDVTKWPLLHRRALLQAVLEPVPKRLEFVKHKAVEEATLTRDERQKRLQDFFFTAFNEGEEGLVVKDLSSEYCIGEKSRQKAHWVKMKPEYSDQV